MRHPLMHRSPNPLALALALLASPALPVAAEVVPIGWELVTTARLEPLSIAHAGDGSGRLFLVLRPGVIDIFDGAQLLPTPFLDIRDRVHNGMGERGLLGLAFHPDYSANGFFYLDYIDNQGDTVIARFSVSADPDIADPNSELLLLGVDQPFENHNGGQLAFGPDGYLHIALGDGGSFGDPLDNGQDLTTLLGKILRIDVDGDDFPGDPERNYAIPPDNPFVGDPDTLDEIWAYGMRNPWRFSFDRATGDLFIGDAGEDSIEEIDLQPAGSPGGVNYGWSLMEGSDCFDPPSDCNDGSLELPILEYTHAEGCAVIGGYRYRGTRNPGLAGRYFYGDYCSGRIWGATETGGEWSANDPVSSSFLITTLGEDEIGELYFAVPDEDGRGIYRIFDRRPFCDVEMSQDSYGDGETVTLQVARLVNRGMQAVTVSFELRARAPGGQTFTLLDLPSVTLPPDSDRDAGPRGLLSVTPRAPRGEYRITCLLSDPGNGAPLARDTATFAIE